MGKEMSPETRAFIDAHAGDNVQKLALQAARHPHVDMATAIVQIAARQKAVHKLPAWSRTDGLRYPPHLSMEQCSSEVTARYKATLVPAHLKEKGFTDLTGGFGVDFCYLAAGFAEATYVERNAALCELAEHNMPHLGLPEAHIVHADAVTHLATMSEQGVIFIDPARRDVRGRKTVLIEDCEPDIKGMQELLLQKAERVIVKLSPMLDITQAVNTLPHVCEVHVVAVAGECKELLLVMEREACSADARIHCINLPALPTETYPDALHFTLQEECACPCLMAQEPGRYLYEPNSAIMKAGAFRTVAHRYGVQKLHPNSHLYTSEQPVKGFPGRCFEIVKHGNFGRRELRELHEQLPKANLTVRNFPASVEELRKRMKLQDGGEEYLFATTLTEERKCWIWGRRFSPAQTAFPLTEKETNNQP